MTLSAKVLMWAVLLTNVALVVALTYIILAGA